MAEEKSKAVEKEEGQKTCFVIMPFSDPDGYEDGHFQCVYEDIFSPAIKEAGFVPERVDEDFASTQIVAKIVEGLSKAEMVLCDLSTNNPNVLYELGIRHAFDLPVVLVQDNKTQRRIFDVAGLATHEYCWTMKHREVQTDVGGIKTAITHTYEKRDSTSVIQIAKIEKAQQNISVAEGDQQQIMIQGLAQDVKFVSEMVSNLMSMTNNTNRTVTKSLDMVERNYMTRQKQTKSSIRAASRFVDMVDLYIADQSFSDADAEEIEAKHDINLKFLMSIQGEGEEVAYMIQKTNRAYENYRMQRRAYFLDNEVKSKMLNDKNMRRQSENTSGIV